MIEIDGSFGEGGGQIIRTSLSLSAITQTPIKITNIRANRKNPGLQPQHLMCAKAVRNISRGTLDGAEIGSKELLFHPGPIVGGKYDFDIGTAGSTILLAQTILPILLFATKASQIHLVGGTHNPFAPTYEYFENVFLSALTEFGVNSSSKLIKAGYYPSGGGEIAIFIEPTLPNGAVSFPRSFDVRAIISISKSLDKLIAVREKKIFVQNSIENVSIYEQDSLSPGNAMTCFRGLCGSCSIGEKGKRAEVVATEALDSLKSETADVDVHLADQLLLYAFLAKGETKYSTSSFSKHFETNLSIIKKFIKRDFSIDKKNNSISVF